MEYQKSKKIYNIFRFFLLFFLIIKQSKSSDSPSINFPYSIILSNDNIFVIHENGVSIYDSTFSNLISNEVIFSGTKINHEYYLSKVTVSQFENGYIIAIILDEIYFFDYKGSFIIKTTQNLPAYTFGAYYSLVPIKYYNGYFFYIIGFVSDDFLYLCYYKFHLVNKENITIQSKAINVNEVNTFIYRSANNGLTCQLMNKNFNDEFLECFFLCGANPNQVCIFEYTVTETKVEYSTESAINLNKPNIKYFKSVVNYSKTKSFI